MNPMWAFQSSDWLREPCGRKKAPLRTRCRRRCQAPSPRVDETDVAGGTAGFSPNSYGVIVRGRSGSWLRGGGGGGGRWWQMVRVRRAVSCMLSPPHTHTLTGQMASPASPATAHMAMTLRRGKVGGATAGIPPFASVRLTLAIALLCPGYPRSTLPVCDPEYAHSAGKSPRPRGGLPAARLRAPTELGLPSATAGRGS